MGGAIVSHGRSRGSASDWRRVGRLTAADGARRAAAVLGVAAILAACNGAPGTATGSPASTTASPASATSADETRFTSFRSPYRVDLPKAWTVLASSQQPGGDEDAFVAPDRATWVTVGTGQPLPGQTVKDRRPGIAPGGFVAIV